ncbi:MAG: acyl-CoA dehydrogenase family protein [Firmicutes bacterium]|uniref:Acyl-CoA dehydrogenase n=1 Tax=Melghirimyces thermohalophilus TaxID=1236220 RepID=A0A1G6IRN1_9BACL|nr:acyl-CoA dehydrogenase family protein [Melghirimyces thermohalophilus]MDA8351598.1 acyl-CoA dehydrogenase family protein [Bacillota bacterium]SDC09101.1 acyl-CoA dehydrogenase [Melghirimyces thermohalophilus]
MVRTDTEIKQLTTVVRDFVREVVEPVAQTIEQEDLVPEKVTEQAKELGLFGLSIPTEYDGLGLNMTEKCMLLEELGKTHNGFTSLIGAHTGIGTVGIVELGNEEQKRRFLPEMARGERLGAFALSEPEAGSNAANLRTRAERKGDRYILNGMKHFITNGPEADVITVMAVTDPTKGAKGITSFLVEADTPGLSRGPADEKMGLRGSHTCQLFFEDVEVPVENRLGEEGQGYVNALKILANGRASLAARCLGSCEKLLELSMDYAMQRKQFGQPIFENQAVQHMLADTALEIETLRSLLYRVTSLVDQGEKVIKESAAVKLYASEVYNRVADRAVQIFGGMGYMKEFPVERFYRDARITRIYEGTSEIQRNIIAAQLKREYTR